MFRMKGWLAAALGVCALALTQCSTSVDQCEVDEDCASSSTPRCSPALKKCVQCVFTSDCPAGHACTEQGACAPVENASCSTDADCAKSELKFCNPDTERCDWECRIDERERVLGCESGHDCIEHRCEMADACKECRMNEFCFEFEKCITKPSSCAKSPCKLSTEICLQFSGREQTCYVHCDPTKSNPDGTNPSCWESYGICLTYSQGKGICAPPPQRRNLIGELCLDYLSMTEPSFHDCVAGAVCVGSDTEPSTCRKRCSLTNNPEASPECDGNACLEHPYMPNVGYCSDRPANRDWLQGCHRGDDPAAEDWGDCKKPYTCALFASGDGGICTSQCGLLVGVGCPEGSECSSPLGGYCLPVRQPTRGLGESCGGNDPRDPSWNVCSSEDMPCIGYVCRRPRERVRPVGESCQVDDDTSAGYDDCDDEGFCVGQKCIQACDPKVATPATHPACGTGTYCAEQATAPKGGYCKTLPSPPSGTALLGDSCTSSKKCNGASGLYCEYGICVKACDPRSGVEGNPACAEGVEECVENPTTSFLGGGCLEIGSRQVNEPCAMVKERCVPGAGCVSADGLGDPVNLCQQTCDPDQLEDGCPEGTGCDPDVRACIVLRQLSRNENEDCRRRDPRKPEYHDCAAGLGCDQYPSRETYGKCVPGLPHPSECSGAKVCESGTTCVGASSVGHYYCLHECRPSRDNCPAGWQCLSTGGDHGACVQTCVKQTDCGYGTVCRQLQEGGPSFCL